ncbi:hypothetical protein F4778DRAFT_771869 [Xylariomycetidae sp. FL2044]|nr:hypothetical protein F4778DRAFT_771869 [Xylariomycetidae sp. FL2044]
MTTWDCDTCNRKFNSWHARIQHMDAKGHSAPECSHCDDTFANHQACKEHEIEQHYWCPDCKRTFQSSNNIKMHMNSRHHRGRTIACPFCKTAYATAAGLSHHLESGSCGGARGLDRDQVYRFVRSKDPSGLLSKNLIGWQGSPSYEATAKTWNGDAYECYFCHREFGGLKGLNQHLSSPALFWVALYHCPNRAGCGKDFTSLAGVFNHLESESCGFTRFETVQRNVGDIVSGNQLIAFN